MPTPRIFSHDIDLKGYKLKNVVFSPLTTTERTALTLDTADEGFTVFDTTLNSPFYWSGSSWITWPGGGAGSDFLAITYNDFQSLTGGSTTLPYYVTTAGREGFFYYTGTVADQSTDNTGTIIVTADLKQYRRSYTGSIDIRWFGGVSDYNGTTGTDNTPALQAAINASAGTEVYLDGKGVWYFNGVVNMVSNSVKYKLTIDADTVHAAGTSGFLIDGFFHSFRHRGAMTSRNSGGVYSGYVGNGVYIRNGVQCYVEINHAQNWGVGIKLAGDANGAGVGCQYNEVHYRMIHACDVCILLTTHGSTGGAGYCNENFIYGGQLGRGVTAAVGGNYGIRMVVGDDSTSVTPFHGNKFYNTGIEGIVNGVHAQKAENNTFMNGRVEGGPGANTSVFYFEDTGTHPLSGTSLSCRDNVFIGWAFKEARFVKKGGGTLLSGCKIYTPSGGVIGDGLSMSLNSTKLLHFAPVYSFTTFNETVHDVHAFGGHTAPLRVFTRSKINGTERFLDYNRVYQDVPNGTATIALAEGATYLRVNTASSALVLTTPLSSLSSGIHLILEVVAYTNPISIINDTNPAITYMGTSAVTSSGRWILTFVSANGSFRADKLGAGSGSGTITLSAIGSAPNVNAATITGSVLNLQPANASFGGVITVGAQDIPGTKTFLDNVAIRKATPVGLTIETTSSTESHEASSDLLSVTSGAQLRVYNSSVLQLGRKDTTQYSSVAFANGKTFGSGRQWTIGNRPGDNSLYIYNDANSLSVAKFAGLTLEVGNTGSNAASVEVHGDVRMWDGGQLYLGVLNTEPGAGINGQLYYNTALNKFRGYEASTWKDVITVGGGGGGGGITSLNALTGATQTFAVGTAGTNFAITSSGTTHTFNLPDASAANRGLVTTGTQTFGSTTNHTKTFNGTVVFGKTGSTAAGTAIARFQPAGALMLVNEPNTLQYYQDDLFLTTAANDIYKIATSANVLTFTNKTWWGATIGTAYGGTGLSSIGGALQVLRVNAAGTGLEYAAISGSGVTASNGLTVTSGDVRLGGTLNSGTTNIFSAASSASSIGLGTDANPHNVIGINAKYVTVKGRVRFMYNQSYGNVNFDVMDPPVSDASLILLTTLTANRTITFSTGQLGEILYIKNNNNNGFTYSISGTVQDKTGTAITSLTNGRTYTFICLQGSNGWQEF